MTRPQSWCSVVLVTKMPVTRTESLNNPPHSSLPHGLRATSDSGSAVRDGRPLQQGPERQLRMEQGRTRARGGGGDKFDALAGETSSPPDFRQEGHHTGEAKQGTSSIHGEAGSSWGGQVWKGQEVDYPNGTKVLGDPEHVEWEAVPVEVEMTPEGLLRQRLGEVTGQRFDYVYFEGASGSLSKQLQSTLAKLHVMLGHVSNDKLKRMLLEWGKGPHLERGFGPQMSGAPSCGASFSLTEGLV